MAVNTNGWKIEAKSYWENLPKICVGSLENRRQTVCGSDGKDYWNLAYFRCIQAMEYGKRVNLQLRHEWPCFVL